MHDEGYLFPRLLLTVRTLQDLKELLQCLIASRAQPEVALHSLDTLAGRHVERLRGLTKSIQDARLARDSEAMRSAIHRYDDALERYIPGA
jgi:tetratricopeptide repeat protein 30